MLNDAPRRMPPEEIPPARRLFFDPFFKGDVKQQLYIDGSYGLTRDGCHFERSEKSGSNVLLQGIYYIQIPH